MDKWTSTFGEHKLQHQRRSSSPSSDDLLNVSVQRRGQRRPKPSRPRAQTRRLARSSDSSLDESSAPEQQQQGPTNKRSRASRTERYLKRKGPMLLALRSPSDSSALPAPQPPPTPPCRDRSSMYTCQRMFGEPAARRRSSQNLEEALRELEAIYNSLQLGDEELLDRAERRSMEEMLYKGLAASPEPLAEPQPPPERQPADRLKDDMAYRRMRPNQTTGSPDSRSLNCGFSYLLASPSPPYHSEASLSPVPRPASQPDAQLDDLAFRNVRQINQRLKLPEQQPPFGIPLGPISAAADSDYLHADPAESDIVADDLAFRSLRKDTQPRPTWPAWPAWPPCPSDDHTPNQQTFDETSIYQQLCRELDNLLQLTRPEPTIPTIVHESPTVIHEDPPPEQTTPEDLAELDDRLHDDDHLQAFRRSSLITEEPNHWQGMNKCNHKYHSMPAKTSSLLAFRQYATKRKSKNRKSICSIS